MSAEADESAVAAEAIIPAYMECSDGGFSILTHWGRDKMANILQTTFPNVFLWMKIVELALSKPMMSDHDPDYHGHRPHKVWDYYTYSSLR